MFVFFFFKQKTAYEMRISDWSSDVCSSDLVLHATAEERRGFIEEAAGILKHRRRKEKTLRKLDAMQANLTRLSDLAGEIRRQLKPLGQQIGKASCRERVGQYV